MASRKRASALLGFGAVAFLAACSGKIVDIGGQSSESQLLPSAVNVATNECGAGYAHSNICCTGGDATTAPSCVTWLDEPFHPCPTGYTTYPNAVECCSLDNPSDCSQCGSDVPPASDAGTPDGVYNDPSQGGDTPVADPNVSSPSSNACGGGTTLPQPIDGGSAGGGGGPSGYPGACDARCPPGYTGVSPYDPAGCCTFDSSGASTCFGEARAGNTGNYPDDASVNPGGPTVDASTPDAGPDSGFKDGGTSVDAGYPGTDAGDPPPYDPNAVCGFSCPDGWFVEDVASGVCCSNDKDGNEQCFAVAFPGDNGGSGAVDPGNSVEPTDAGPPPPIGD